MARQVQRRRGSTADHVSFIGAVGEITVDTDKKTAVVHDGVTPGGFPLVREQDGLSYVSGDGILHIVALTQDDYDALAEKDILTLYVIVPPVYNLFAGNYQLQGNDLLYS